MVGGNLPIFLIKLFGQDGELLDLLHAGHGLIHVSHFTLDQFYDLRTPDQVLVSGKLDFVILAYFTTLSSSIMIRQLINFLLSPITTASLI
jgi:hypothetical protein